MTLVIMIAVGAVIGGVSGALFWWGVNRQPVTDAQSAPTPQPPPEEVRPPETQAAGSKPNLIPIGYGLRRLVYDPATQTFKQGDNGFLTAVVEFRNAYERDKDISEAKGIRAHIYYEPSEFYKNLDRNIPGFARVDNGIWLDEKHFLVNFTPGETKTLILVVQMPDGGFGGFDHRFEKADGMERLFPRIPKLTADKYVVKIELTGGAHGYELYHFTITLRPEFNISYG